MAFDGGNNINVANILPSDNPVATKIFTVTGNNTTELHMGYSLYLVVDENTFNTYSIQYRLRSENTGGSGTVAVENEELISLKNDKHIYLLGYGTFDAPTDGNKVHTYTLEIYFPHMLFNQNEDQGKIFKSHIVIEDYSLVSDRMMSAIKIKEKITRMDMYNYFSEKYLYEYTQRNDLNEEQREDLLAISDNYTNMASDIFNELTSVKFLNTTLNNSSIESIDFVDINVVPGGVLGSFDISEKQNGSVMLWYENGSVAGRYKITIGQNGGVRAPTHADSLFGFLRNLKTINGNVNTSQTKTMSYMFYSTGANVNSFIADLSNWNVSNVTDMSNLFVFSGFNSLIWNVGNLNNWDVSNVVNMSGVFSSAGYSATTWNIGDLSNWNVSNVTNMTQTFCFS